MLTASLLILIGCQTAPKNETIEIPPFLVSIPDRPELESIPLDPQQAIMVMTKNMNLLVNHIEKLEIFDEYKENYFLSFFHLINN